MSGWLKNILGIPGWSPTEEQMKQIDNPTLELTVHVTYKTVEAFSLIGAWLVVPLYKALKRKKYDSQLLSIKGRRIGGGFLVVGTALGPLLTYAKIKGGNLNQDQIYDRCYRLRYNINQVNVDRWVTYAGPVAFLGTRSIFGTMCGINAAVCAAAVYNNYLRGQPKAGEKEKKEGTQTQPEPAKTEEKSEEGKK